LEYPFDPMDTEKTYEQLVQENKDLALQLEEATETIHAIRTGQVDALVVQDSDGSHQLYTLKTADQTYRVFIEKMSEGAVTINEKGIILYSNSMFACMVDMQLSSVIGLSFDHFVADDYKDVYGEIFEKAWLGHDHKAELSIRKGNGLVPCQLSVAALELDEGISLSVILTDLTFQKEIQLLLKNNNQRLEEINLELEASNHDLQQFASVASHDLQEPLRKILIFSSLLRSNHFGEFSETSATYLDKVISSANRMKTMIVDVLSYSRLSTNTYQFEVVNLTDIIKEVLEDY
jgi:PAS domain S-box-containing protein